MTDNDYYEDDEDPKDIEAAFNRSVKGFTQAPYAAPTWTTGVTYSRVWLPNVGWTYSAK
jgi:hypothetical protein